MKKLVDLHWEEVSEVERRAVADTYNMYYNTESEPLSFETLNMAWTGCNWITIKYTFGIKPLAA